jgi:peroxiredoxin Q/BCP
MVALHKRLSALQLAAVMLAVTAATASVASAQTPAPGSAATAPNVGDMAPDFSLPGATRFGLLKDPVKLSDFRGQTVVLAFFPKARTKG